MDANPGEITRLLNRPGDDREKCARLAELVNSDLRQIASRVMGWERSDHTLQATAVADDAYLRLTGQSKQVWDNRKQFYAAAAKTMRQILVDYSRRRGARKRGGDIARAELEDVEDASSLGLEELLALDQALQRLERKDKRLMEIVDLRYFAGLTEEETATVLGLSLRTIKREWSAARLWLHAELTRRR